MPKKKQLANVLNTGKDVSPFKKLISLFLAEKKSLIVFLIYAAIISLLYLAVPVAAQILVNTIAAGILIQPLILISVSVLIGLIFLGVLRIFQLYITEILQRKIFAKISINIAQTMPRIEQKHFSEIYAPELTNRFFDVVTIQKALTLILLEVPAAAMQIFVGLILMGIYSPLLIIFDTVLIIAIAAIGLLGYRGLKTSINESSSKYKVAYWLEELARCHVSFKMKGVPKFLIDETDNRILNYLQNRKKHFHVLLRQYSASFFIEAFASAGVLAIGGWLVINNQLTLGQLVASELIILMMLSALDKIVQKLESWYDLLTAIDKVSHVTRLSIEEAGGQKTRSNPDGAEIICDNVVFGYIPEKKIFNKVSLSIEPGARKSLVGVSGSGKTTLAHLISGLYTPQEGNILYNGISTRALDLVDLRKNIALVSDFNEIFTGTVKENITLGRADITSKDLDEVIDMVHLERDLHQYSKGLNNELLSEGRNISLGQRQRILLARAIVDFPQLLILDEAFGGMDERTKLSIIEKMFAKDKPWTILNISHDAEVVSLTNYIYLLDKCEITEEGETNKLLDDENSQFSQLFPELSRIKHGEQS